jgi:hypothetical protein
MIDRDGAEVGGRGKLVFGLALAAKPKWHATTAAPR